MRKIYFSLKDTAVPDKTAEFNGYYIIASFVMNTDDGPLNSSLKADCDDTGKGILYLPVSDDIENDLLHFEFYGPGGYWIADKVTLSETSFNAPTSATKPYEFKINILKEKELGKTSYTIRGRVVDIAQGLKVSRCPVFIILSETEEVSPNDYQIVDTLTTDLEGYFKLEMDLPIDKKQKPGFYFAYIPDSEEKLARLSMKDSLIEPRQIIGITYKEKLQPISEGDASCDCTGEETPRLPDATDFISSEGTFSQDLGVGCVEFTKPNRVVEEYQFMHIVRTTDPQIKKVNLNTNTFKEILNSLETELDPPVFTFYMPPLAVWTLTPEAEATLNQK